MQILFYVKDMTNHTNRYSVDLLLIINHDQIIKKYRDIVTGISVSAMLFPNR